MFATLKHHESGLYALNLEGYFYIVASVKKLNWYPYPCVLAVMAHKTTLVVFQQQDRRILFCYI